MVDIISVMSALAEPTRLSAVGMLFDGGEHCVCELMRKLGATQSRMSRHMAKLQSAGIVVDRRDAQWVRYRLNPEMPASARSIVDAAVSAIGTHRKERKAG